MVGMVVRVTRWKRYWLYGDLVLDQGEARTRGWFPRQCAAELVDHTDCCSGAPESAARKSDERKKIK